MTLAPAERHDLRRQLVAALGTLPPDQRAALVLVDMQGYPVAEAARILDVPTGTVKSRCSRGRARLLPLLTHLRPGPGTEVTAPGAGTAPGAEVTAPNTEVTASNTEVTAPGTEVTAPGAERNRRRGHPSHPQRHHDRRTRPTRWRGDSPAVKGGGGRT
ncbi:RNA polymerase sigma factor SigM OS=Streptomyces fumanus OX=67302 GN=GCM10018772_12660 PE=3 SV=1 [Streptomyces fumanus]